MIPYAGYDETEDHVDALREDDEFNRRYNRREKTGRIPIDAAMASALRAEGIAWDVIGHILAREINRPLPFTASAVCGAVNRYNKGKK